MSAVYTTTFQSNPGAGFTLADLTSAEGVWSPGSNVTPLQPQQVLPIAGVPRALVAVRDIYIVSDVAHSLNLYYRRTPLTAVPSLPSFANGDVLIYQYAGRTNVNPFHEDDDNAKRLKTIFFGESTSNSPPTNAGGTLQFQVPVFAGVVKVVVHWTLTTPGGGYG